MTVRRPSHRRCRWHRGTVCRPDSRSTRPRRSMAAQRAAVSKPRRGASRYARCANGEARGRWGGWPRSRPRCCSWRIRGRVRGGRRGWGFRRPHTVTKPGFAGLGGAARLLAAPGLYLGLAQRQAGTVQRQVRRWQRSGCGRDPPAFVGRDLAAQRFGGALDLLGRPPRRPASLSTRSPSAKADARRRQSQQPRRGGRQRGVPQTQGQVAGRAS